MHSSTQPNEPIDDTIVVTSAIYPAPEVFRLKMSDPRTRLLQTYCGLLGWIRETSATRIVVCDNSAVPALFDPIVALASTANIELEVLSFQSDADSVSKFGKGYGEGEILAHAMHNSRLIRERPNFYKVTGRQFVKNFDAIHASHRQQPLVFWPNPKRAWTDTRFFKCSREFYTKYLMDCYRDVRDREGRYLEHIIEATIKKRTPLEPPHDRPVVVGFSASSGMKHDSDFGEDIVALATELLPQCVAHHE